MSAIRFNIADYQAKKKMCWPKRKPSAITPLPPPAKVRARDAPPKVILARGGPARLLTPINVRPKAEPEQDDVHSYPNPGLSVQTLGLVPQGKPGCAQSSHPLVRAPFRKTRLAYFPASDLPPMGWIQCCLFCENPTTRLERAGTVRGYCCGRCRLQFGSRDIGRSIRNIHARIQ